MTPKKVERLIAFLEVRNLGWYYLTTSHGSRHETCHTAEITALAHGGMLTMMTFGLFETYEVLAFALELWILHF